MNQDSFIGTHVLMLTCYGDGVSTCWFHASQISLLNTRSGPMELERCFHAPRHPNQLIPSPGCRQVRQQIEEQVAQKSTELEQYLQRVRELEDMYRRLEDALEDERHARQDEEAVRRLQARWVRPRAPGGSIICSDVIFNNRWCIFRSCDA